ncbi:Cna B-type domain-containing protein [Amedibacillus dolichus]|uniref:Cna B-type domain-containing protein n=1 Tax=Amedibacillus dolichus TaxID=31971 RepID=UPI001EDB6756|nr:Cna B-type domain-containing protein [Amedibacillus dolichus]MCG4880086.1 Cna B-type domain-containing protein [Amedibacillus dolichus]
MKKTKATRLLLLMLSLVVAFSSFNVYEISDKNIYAEVNENEDYIAPAELSEDYSHLYKDEAIHIYNLEQLKAIGTNQKVKDLDETKEGFGLGKDIVVDNQTITYSLDATYILENDIALNGEKWNLPEGFNGSFLSKQETGSPQLYDEDTDTIYIYNSYQLDLIQSDSASLEPILSLDYDVTLFGQGKLIYPNNSQDYVTYSNEHTYVLSKNFTALRPATEAIKVQKEQEEKKQEIEVLQNNRWGNAELSGRDYIGQVYKELNGVKYILIGNKQQLAAIGSNKQVTPTLVLHKMPGLLNPTSKYTPLYPGDADFKADITLTLDKSDSINFKYFDGNITELMNVDFSKGLLGSVNDILGGLLGGLLTGDHEILGYDSQNGTYISETTLKSEYSDLKYSGDANYIIFRDIDLNNIEWKPLMFSGTMVGAVSEDKNTESTLWNDSGIVNTRQSVISNITVNQTSPIDIKEQSGVGFFGSIMSKSTQKIGVVDQQVSVKNIKLQNISVTNATSEIVDHRGLIQGLLELLDKLLSGLLGDLGDVLGNLLNPNGDGDPSVFATGSFAGRISGDVSVEDCVVENVIKISNVNDLTGGFVGHVEGITEYGGLQDALGTLTTILEEILNIIPFVDLGTLIEVLLDGNIIDLNKLIPTGYKSPTISNCYLDNSGNNLSVGNIAYNYQGGFVGKAVGTQIKNSSIKANSLTVEGKNMAGGFAGYSANAELVGVLNGLGIELFNAFQLNTFLLNGRVETNNLSVHANEKYGGGISGALANSFIVDCSVSGTTNITADSYAGGISGIAALGQSISLKDFYTGKKDLTGLLGSLLSGILTQDEENVLLSLTGISPSVLAGNEITGSLTVKANDKYAGGMVGQGDGVKIISSSDLKVKSYVWKNVIGELNYTVLGRKNTISNLKEISAQSRSGGVIGEAKTASAGGILNKTLGIGNFLGFEIENITISSINAPGIIHATQDYAGGFAGKAMGGTVSNVHISELQKVEANNYAGGFAGYGGTGSLAETGALNILGLVKIANLLDLAQGLVLDISECDVQGTTNGFTVKALGTKTSDVDVTKYYAGGFIGKSTSVHIRNSHVKGLKDVTADGISGYAGGFAGATETGGLADAANKDTEALKLLGINGLLNAVPYLVSDFKNTTVAYQPESAEVAQVRAAYAGGFIGEMQSGYIDNKGLDKPYAVSNILNVKGTYYAGGFGGKIYSGGLATAGDLSILNGLLNINASNLLSVLNVYIPIINSAGVSSKGLIVEVTSTDINDSNSGSAGGYVGYGSGLKISNSHVNQLRHTTVKAPSDLNSNDGSSYFSDQSKYAIKGLRYAGGYVGKLDIGSSAALGSGLGVLGNVLGLNDVTQALDVVASQIEHSNVLGEVGGYSVLANFKAGNDLQGHSGGYAGSIDGSSLQDCNAYNFEYIIGQETAGGYVGRMQPGNVASVIGNADILGGLLEVEGNLLSILQSFIPMIYNSETTSVPCGGAVRANAASDETRERGLAGGYVGHNIGGRIEGMSEREWNKKKPTVLKENAAVRIRNVYGYEFTGGFSGRTENANVADTGNLHILFGIINISNPLSALGAVYSTETNTAVYGPLRKLTVDVWNAWVGVVGVNGAYGQQLQELGKVETQEQLNGIIEKYAYGYDVKAAREIAGTLATQGGSAGGYVGRMDGGVVTSGQAHDIKLVTAYRSSGGFVGEMSSAGVANVGGIQIGDLDVVGSLPVLQTFVPVIKTSSAYGYRSGATILANGTDLKNQQGNAGGFAGIIIGGQIEGKEDNFCSIEKLKTVKGTNTIGGFVGSILSGSAAEVNIGSNDGLLPILLKPILGNPDKLASLLNATVSTIKYAKVDAWDNWGITIDGRYQKENDPNTQYTYASGGFAGNMSGAVLGDKGSNSDSLIVNNIRKVIGGEHVGGFFGLADVAAVAEVGDNASNGILGLIKLGELDVLDAFRTYIYHASVRGSTEHGLIVSANTQNEAGGFESTVQTGNTGGFGGSLLNGSVKNASVTNLNQVNALNYSGGFIGHLGKSGVVDLDKAATGGALTGLLNATAGVLDNFGSHCDDCKVDGIQEGFLVNSQNGKKSISGGFAGLADLAKINNSHVTNIKKVNSDQIAGGFVGRTTFSYLADIDAGSTTLLNPVLSIVNKLLDILYVGDLQNLGVIDLGLGKLLEIKLLSDGKTLSVTLLGLPISVALVRNNGDGTSDLAQIHIGDSYIEIPCTSTDGNHISKEDKKNINIGLIKSNRTSIKNSSITGISIGYDVFGGGANDEKDGTDQEGYAGGFVGYNDEGLFENNQMYYADTIRGIKDKVGPFVGETSLDSKYDFNTVENIEGNHNGYRVYRDHNELTSLIVGGEKITAESSNINWNEFVISHIKDVETFDKFENAILSSVDIKEKAGVYVSSAKAVLMEDKKTSDNEENLTPPPSDMQDPCDELINLTINKIWKDFGNFENIRPAQIELLLTRTYEANGTVVKDEQFEQTIIVKPSDDMQNIWRETVKGLEAYKVLDGGTHAYYTYQLTEKEVDGYSTTIESSEDGFTITITNSHIPFLPDTGGIGTYVFTFIGMIGIAAVFYSLKKGRKKNEKHA